MGEQWFNNVAGELREGSCNQRQIMSWEAGQRQEIKLGGDPGGRSQRALNALCSRDTYCSPNIHLLPTFPSLLAVGGNHATGFTNVL